MTLAPDEGNWLPLVISKLETDHPLVDRKFIQPRPSEACRREGSRPVGKQVSPIEFVHIDALVLFDRANQECTMLQLGLRSRSQIAIQKLIEGYVYRIWIVAVAFP
jgi:hypothetical protein